MKKTVAETITNEEVENLGDSRQEGDGVIEGRRSHRQSLDHQKKLLLCPSFPFMKPRYSSEGGGGAGGDSKSTPEKLKKRQNKMEFLQQYFPPKGSDERTDRT